MIRTAKTTDLEALAQLELSCFAGQAWSRQTWQSELAGDHQVELAIVDEKLVAFVVVMRAGDDAELLRIAVDPAQRRKRIGQALLNRAVDIAQAAGAE